VYYWRPTTSPPAFPWSQVGTEDTCAAPGLTTPYTRPRPPARPPPGYTRLPPPVPPHVHSHPNPPTQTRPDTKLARLIRQTIGLRVTYPNPSTPHPPQPPPPPASPPPPHPTPPVPPPATPPPRPVLAEPLSHACAATMGFLFLADYYQQEDTRLFIGRIPPPPRPPQRHPASGDDPGGPLASHFPGKTFAAHQITKPAELDLYSVDPPRILRFRNRPPRTQRRTSSKGSWWF